MGDTKLYLDENGLNQLERTIKAHRFGFWFSLVFTLTFLIGFAFVPYQEATSDKWMYMLLHVLIPIAAVALTIPVFRLSKQFAIEGMKIKLTNLELDERRIKPLGIFNLIIICWATAFCVGVPVILVLVILRANRDIGIVWVLLAGWAVFAATEFQLVRTLEDLRSDSHNRASIK
jgi:hypothetical protein